MSEMLCMVQCHTFFKKKKICIYVFNFGFERIFSNHFPSNFNKSLLLIKLYIVISYIFMEIK